MKIHPLCTSDQRENFKWGPWGAVYLTSQGDSTLNIGKAIVSALWIDHKKTRRMASAKCSRATTGFSTSCGRGKYWLIYQKPGGQEKGRPFTTVGLKCCTAIPENANTCAANTYRLALLIVIQSYLQNRGQKKDDRRPNAIGMKFSLLRFRDLCSEGSSV